MSYKITYIDKIFAIKTSSVGKRYVCAVKIEGYEHPHPVLFYSDKTDNFSIPHKHRSLNSLHNIFEYINKEIPMSIIRKFDNLIGYELEIVTNVYNDEWYVVKLIK